MKATIVGILLTFSTAVTGELLYSVPGDIEGIMDYFHPFEGAFGFEPGSPANKATLPCKGFWELKSNKFFRVFSPLVSVVYEDGEELIKINYKYQFLLVTRTSDSGCNSNSFSFKPMDIAGEPEIIPYLLMDFRDHRGVRIEDLAWGARIADSEGQASFSFPVVRFLEALKNLFRSDFEYEWEENIHVPMPVYIGFSHRNKVLRTQNLDGVAFLFNVNRSTRFTKAYLSGMCFEVYDGRKLECWRKGDHFLSHLK